MRRLSHGKIYIFIEKRSKIKISKKVIAKGF